MEQISEILKAEIDAGMREHNEMVYAIPVLKRIVARLDVYLEEERSDKNTHTAFGLFLAITEIKKEIEKLEGKQ